jgi:single-strand DNA-binding protein
MKNNVFTVKGSIKSVEETRTVGQKNTQVREFVVETEEDYTQLLKFELYQEKVSLADGLSTGDQVNVYFSVRGREWQDKVYNSLRAFRVEADAAGPAGDSVAAEAFKKQAEGEGQPVF